MTSRLCVKNLPQNISEAKFKEIFSAKGEVTDVKLVKSSSTGKNRGILFVGFRHAEQAEEAQRYFNHTYMGTVRVSVELARKFGDDGVLENAKSKYSKEKLDLKQQKDAKQKQIVDEKKSLESKAAKSLTSKITCSNKEPPSILNNDIANTATTSSTATTNTTTSKKDKDRLDFLEVMKPRHMVQKWANDEDLTIKNTESNSSNSSNINNKALNKIFKEGDDEDEDEDDEYDDILVTQSKNNNKTTVVQKKDTSAAAAIAAANVPPTSKSVSSDIDFLRSKVKSDFSDDEDDKDVNSDGDSDDNNSDDDDDNRIQATKQRQQLLKANSIKSSSSTITTKKAPLLTYTVSENNQVSTDTNNTSIKSSSFSINNTVTTEKNDHDENVLAGDSHDNHNDNDTNSNYNDSSETRISHTGRLFVRNLPYGCTEDELNHLFTTYGPISEVHIPLDTGHNSGSSGSTDCNKKKTERQEDHQKRGKGYGFVQFMIPEHATHALQSIDGTSFQGRLLHIIAAKDKKNDDEDEDGNGGDKKGGRERGSEYQQKKEKDRRSMAGQKDSWNASYVRSDTVVASLAEKYGMRRGEVLDTSGGASGGELAVRLAVGETQVLQDNMAYLAEHGVDLAALESVHSNSNNNSSSFAQDRRASSRSNTTLLIKNLPHDCSEDELKSMFARFGSVSDFILPPSKSVALIVFIEPVEARNAFKGLAYKKYKHLPLYLEWAPLGIIKSNHISNNIKNNASSGDKKTGENDNNMVDVIADTKNNDNDDIEDTGDDYSTLYIKNLNFQTTESSLKSHLHSLNAMQGFRTLSIPEKQPSQSSSSSNNNNHTKQTMGFGFIEYVSVSYARVAIKVLNGSILDDHTLEVKPSEKKISSSSNNIANIANNKRSSAAGGKMSNKMSNKLLVRNVAFQATQTEIKALFSSFGNVKRVRIPRKLGGVHRGFAFVDMSSSQEAYNAMQSLSSSHLYGRHLIIEEAKATTEDDNEEEDNDEGNSNNNNGGFKSHKKNNHNNNSNNNNNNNNNNSINSEFAKLTELRKRARKDEKILSTINNGTSNSGSSGGGVTKKSKKDNSDGSGYDDGQFNDTPAMHDQV